MPRRRSHPKNLAVTIDANRGLSGASVVVLAPDPDAAAHLASRLRHDVGEIRLARTALEAHGMVGRAADLVIVLGGDEDATACVARLRAMRPAAAVVLVASAPTLDDAVRALHAGAQDLIPADLPLGDILRRLQDAISRTRQASQTHAASNRRVERLRRLCRTLNVSRRELLGQVASLCGDLDKAYSELADRAILGNFASEFNALVRQELDIEGLLRTVLESILPKIGPTNAAVFLPSSSGDFSLGAYVNADRPRDSAEMLFDQLAGVVAPAFELEPELRHFPDAGALSDRLGEHADWIEGCASVAFACRHDEECLAVVLFFRDAHQPFTPEILQMLGVVRASFTQQLARVVHTHHRHLPKHKWGTLGDDDDGNDDLDLAA